MKVCIFGAGAIGGYMGVKLAKAGADVSLVARGPHLAAMQEKGLTLIEEGETTTVPVTASDDPAALGVQDYVIVTLKAHSVPPVVSKMAPLIGPKIRQRGSRQCAMGWIWPRSCVGMRCLSRGRGD